MRRYNPGSIWDMQRQFLLSKIVISIPNKKGNQQWCWYSVTYTSYVDWWPSEYLIGDIIIMFPFLPSICRINTNTKNSHKLIRKEKYDQNMDMQLIESLTHYLCEVMLNLSSYLKNKNHNEIL